MEETRQEVKIVLKTMGTVCVEGAKKLNTEEFFYPPGLTLEEREEAPVWTGGSDMGMLTHWDADADDLEIAFHDLVESKGPRKPFTREVLSELGEEIAVLPSEVYIVKLIQLQISGNTDGVLRIGDENLFFLRNEDGDIYTVEAFFHTESPRQWSVGADYVQGPEFCHPGTRVFAVNRPVLPKTS